MASIYLQGTKFSLQILPLEKQEKEGWARVEICVENERVSYKQTENILADDLENWLFAMFRLLAGAYKREYALSFEDTGLAVDFYAATANGAEVSREERRRRDCLMIIRMLMRSQKGEFLGGVYSLLLHREEIEKFAKAVQKEYDEIFVKRIHGMGEYLFVGVSPWGYDGCNYWYFSPNCKVNKGDCVWVEMGLHNTKQIVRVDSARYFTKETAPYNLDSVKRIISIATEEEVLEFSEAKK